MCETKTDRNKKKQKNTLYIQSYLSKRQNKRLKINQKQKTEWIINHTT